MEKEGLVGLNLEIYIIGDIILEILLLEFLNH